MAKHRYAHKQGYVEHELERISHDYFRNGASQEFVNGIFAEALLMLLDEVRTLARRRKHG